MIFQDEQRTFARSFVLMDDSPSFYTWIITRIAHDRQKNTQVVTDLPTSCNTVVVRLISECVCTAIVISLEQVIKLPCYKVDDDNKLIQQD
jgi:hypothetical protein